MKKGYTKPVIEIVKISLQDVVSASFGGRQAGDSSKAWNTLA